MTHEEKTTDFFVNEQGRLITVDPEGTLFCIGLMQLNEPIYHTPELLWQVKSA